MVIYFAGGYLKPTADILQDQGTDRLFSYYDIIEDRVGMKRRFEDVIQIKRDQK